MKYCWQVAPAQPLLAGQLAKELRLAPLLAQCLLNRGLGHPAAIRQFLAPRLRQLADPFLLPDMEAAVGRLWQAREQGQALVIFGDYDVDGVTSTALLLEVLTKLGWQAGYYLPHRIEEGYGLNPEAVENCLKKFPVNLLLAVDCGSTATHLIARLRQRGVDVIVLDHHQVSALAPAAVALVNPYHCGPRNAERGIADENSAPADLQSAADHDLLRPAPARNFTELCSVGLAFKLAHALVKRGREQGLAAAAGFDLRPLLDLVALGTIADIVPLTGENRILVSAGLDRLNGTQRPGLVALKRVSQCPEPVGTYEAGFQLAPRLNAAGRLETAEDALRLLLARDATEARLLAEKLNVQNRERQDIQRRIAEEALASVRARFDPERDFAIVEGHALWHIGVVGIVAARMVQQFYRPSIIIGHENGEWRGSGRSIAGFDMAAALRECGDLLVRHGGHAMAAGVTIEEANLEAFRARLNDLAHRALKPEQLQAPLPLDVEVGLEELSLPCVLQLGQLRPTGPDNPPPRFLARNLTHQRPLQRMGTQKQHVKMWVTNGLAVHEAVWWGAGQESLPVGQFDLAFSPQVNRYDDRQTVQLKVLDWRGPG